MADDNCLWIPKGGLKSVEQALKEIPGPEGLGLQPWWSTYYYSSDSGGIFNAAKLELFSKKLGDIGQGIGAPGSQYCDTNMNLESRFPYPALLRGIGLRSWIIPFTGEVLDPDCLHYLDAAAALAVRKNQSSDFYLSRAEDFLMGPDRAQAVAGVPVSPVAIQQAWNTSKCGCQMLQTPVAIQAEETFRIIFDLCRPFSTQSQHVHVLQVHCKLLVQPLCG